MSTTESTSSSGDRRDRPTSVLAGLGTCLPSTEIDNAALVAQLDTTDEWIRSRTGIAARRRAAPGVSMRDLACEAGANALSSAGLRAVGGVVLATTTPDRPCPAAAPEVAHRLGLGQVPAFDVSAVCSGFVYATAVANGLITSGVVDSVLIVASEIYSRIVDPTDRGTAVIFGDGAGAVVLRRGTTADQGALLAFDLGGDGSGHHLIQVPSELEQPDGPRWFGMAGRKVYLRAVEQMALSASRVLKDCGWSPEMVDVLVPHQANGRIIQAVAERLGVPSQSAVCEIARTGNTSAASIPLALTATVATGRLAPGARTVLTAFGGGLSWGSAALTWPRLQAVNSEF